MLNDVQMLRHVPWERYQTRDTQQTHFTETDAKKSKTLAEAVLGRSMQGIEHFSVDNAAATMALYLHHERKVAMKADLSDSASSDSGEVNSVSDDDAA